MGLQDVWRKTDYHQGIKNVNNVETIEKLSSGFHRFLDRDQQRIVESMYRN
jgi:hypothetical protein